MKKSLMGIIPLLCVCALVGCDRGKSSESSSVIEVVHVESVVVLPNKSSVYLDAGNTVQLTATVLPETASDKSLTWSSSDPAIATVENGLVTCLKKGDVIITATSVQDSGVKGSARVNVRDTASQDETLDALNQPAFYEKYKQNTQTLDKVSDIQTKDLNRNTYFQNEKGTKDFYRVGDDNPFKLNITGKITDDQGTDTLINDPYILIKVSELNASNQYVELKGGDLEAKVAVAQDKTSLDFTEAAVGHIYKVSIEADPNMYLEFGAGYAPVVLDIEIVDGYNAYDKFDLTLFDNVTAAWATIKAQKGLDQLNPYSLVLHSDITINNDDLPAGLKYSQAEVETYIANFSTDFASWCTKKGISAAEGKALLVNSLKDSVNIFCHQSVLGSESFGIEGNYFKIDCSGIKQVYAFNNAIENGDVSTEYIPDDPTKGCDGSHSQLFAFNNRRDDSFVEGDKFFMNNMTVVSNGDLSNDDKYLGGLITFKAHSVTFAASNVLSSKSFITFFSEHEEPGTKTRMILDRCKSYDSYNSMVYVWGCDYNVITNSVMKRAGGAIALLDEVGAQSSDPADRFIPNVDCYNVLLDNPVSGTEPWFESHKATLLIQMMEMFGDASQGKWLGRNAYLHGNHMNILTLDGANPYINLIAIDIDGRNPLTNSLYTGGDMLRGHFNVYNNPEMTQLIGALDMGKMAAANPAASQADFVNDCIEEALLNGNFLPSYRLMAGEQQSIVAATALGGHAMLSDGNNFANAIIAAYNDTNTIPGVDATPLGTDFTIKPIPFYADNTGTGAEVAANLSNAALNYQYKDVLDALASGQYLSIYMQPVAKAEYLGAFIKMQQLPSA